MYWLDCCWSVRKSGFHCFFFLVVYELKEKDNKLANKWIRQYADSYKHNAIWTKPVHEMKHMVIFWGIKRKENLPSKPRSVTLIPSCDTKQLASLTPWLSECMTAPICIWHLHFKQYIPGADREPMRCESALQRWDTGSSEGFEMQQMKAQAHERRKMVMLSPSSSTDLLKKRLEMSSWLHCDALWWKILLFCLKERKILIERKSMTLSSQKRAHAVILL